MVKTLAECRKLGVGQETFCLAVIIVSEYTGTEYTDKILNCSAY